VCVCVCVIELVHNISVRVIMHFSENIEFWKCVCLWVSVCVFVCVCLCVKLEKSEDKEK
jgi:hypothetical protein